MTQTGRCLAGSSNKKVKFECSLHRTRVNRVPEGVRETFYFLQQVGAFCIGAGMFLISYFEIASAATIELTVAALFIAVELALLARGKKPADPQALKTD